MSNALFRTKKVEQSILDTEEPEHALKKSLSALDLTVFGVGVIIGTGIFVLTGTVARNNAGPAVALAFVAAGVVCALAALCYAEFASTVPVAGSAYTFSYASLGELPAWIIGWDLVLEFALGTAVVAVGWSGYVASLLDNAGWHLPEALSGRDGADGFGFDILAAALVLVLTAILVVGTKLSARVTSVVVAVKVTVVLVVIIAGAFLIKGDNYDPFIPKAQAVPAGDSLQSPLIQLMFGWAPSNFGVMGIFTAASVVFFAFIGFDVVATAAEETRNPQRDMPRGIIGSLVICTALYVAVSIVVTGMQHYTELSITAPLADAFKATGHPWFAGFISFGAAVGLTTVCMILLLGQTRVFFAMSRDGLLPRFFSHVHPRFKTPHRPTILLGRPHRRPRRLHSPERARRAGEHRHALRLRGRRDRRDRPPQEPPRPAPRLPHPLGAGAADRVGAGLAVADAQPARRDLAAVRDLDGDRFRGLLPVRPLPQPAGPQPGDPRRPVTKPDPGEGR
ncbi:APA family basic amino acid/polyamine antiporter [Streptomyces phaeoluteigriseus]